MRDALTISGTDTPGIFAGLGTGAVGRGGDINVQAESILVKDGGRIASFTLGRGNAGNITIQARDAVTFDGVDNSKVISSGSFSSVEAGAIGNGGNINITAGSLSLTNGGELSVAVRGQTDTLPGAQSNAGSVNINVRDALTISGTDTPGIFANLGTGAVGRGGDIKLQAGNVFLKDDGQISSSTFGKGDAGNISITAREAISLDAGVISAVQGSSTLGNGGNITFSTGSLSASHGGQINSFIRGRGNAGNITILAKDAVSFDGVDSSGNPSGLFSSVLAGAIGNGGNINITAGSLSLTNGGELGVNVRGNTGTLPGAQSNGGSVNINVRDALTISGSGSQISSSLGTGAIGRGGDINVLARSFSVSNNAQVTTSSFGRGNAGNLTVAANSINLDKGQLLANSQSGLGGNVFLTVSDLILMRHNSLISNTSGTTQNPGQEGKLTLNTKFLVAAPLENNDIITNAFSGSGGKINITATEGLFGFVVRNGNYSSENINLLQKNNINDIAASSNSGTPNIDTRVNDITQGLIEIPVKVSDVTSKFSQLCPNTANPKKKPLGSFVITGKGSIPPNPLELLPGRNPDIPLATAEDMQEIKNIQAQEQKKKEEQEHNTKVGRKKNKDNTLPSIVEAQGIVQTPDGQIYFVANANHATPSSQPTASPCPSQN
ncbi:S-layer family protein [Aetokthonos hydrillicola]|uniref:beta strand repeat-containing protein n=1 Tax=Aetokthonos hydrillicola TaxID=1550245 RepID=UPI001AFD607F